MRSPIAKVRWDTPSPSSPLSMPRNLSLRLHAFVSTPLHRRRSQSRKLPRSRARRRASELGFQPVAAARSGCLCNTTSSPLEPTHDAACFLIGASMPPITTGGRSRGHPFALEGGHGRMASCRRRCRSTRCSSTARRRLPSVGSRRSRSAPTPSPDRSVAATNPWIFFLFQWLRWPRTLSLMRPAPDSPDNCIFISVLESWLQTTQYTQIALAL